MDSVTQPTDLDSQAAKSGQLFDERALLSALAAGDRRAADQLVDGTYRRVFASLLKLCGGRPDLAADLTQDTYQKAWTSLHRFDQRSLFSTWLYRIAYNTFLNHVRRPARIVPIDLERPLEPIDERPTPDERLDRREARERLRRAVIALPEELRFTITARFWGELPVSEIARLENVTGAAIRKRLKKAMAGLRHTLEGEAIQ
jgi:RNA polymerase sigma-70 factor (ECF subfamily)